MKCPVCDGNAREIIEDHVGSWGHVTLAAKSTKCDDCGFEGVNGSQMRYNESCESFEIEGPFKPIVIHGLHSGSAYFDWGWKGIGFGQLSFNYDRETGKLACMNECMGRESVRQLLHAMADYIADNVELEDE